jgi:hypothetical protein
MKGLPDRTHQLGIKICRAADDSPIFNLYDVTVTVVIRFAGFADAFADPLNDDGVSLGKHIEHGRYRRAGKFLTLGFERVLD